MNAGNPALGFQFVVLWTDVALWAMFAAGVGYVWRVLRHPTLRATWGRVLRDAPAVCSAVVLGLFIAITALDSVHLRRALPAAPGQDPTRTFYDTHTESLLDLALARPIAMRESTYSAPLAWQGMTLESFMRDGQAVRALPRLAHGGAHLAQPEAQWAADVQQRALGGAAGGLAVAVLIGLCAVLLLRHAQLEGERNDLIDQLPLLYEGVRFGVDSLDVALHVGRYGHGVGVDVGIVSAWEVVVVGEITCQTGSHEAHRPNGDQPGARGMTGGAGRSYTRGAHKDLRGTDLAGA
jgi:hypothetical protein